MTITERLRLWRFYRAFPTFRGPRHPHCVGTNNVEAAWRFAEKLGFTTGSGRVRITFDDERRGWSP